MRVRVELRELGSTTPLFARTVSLAASGSFTLAVPFQGDFDIAAKGPNWLRQTLGAVEIGYSGVSGLSFTLINGDVNGDNTVNIADFLALRAAFGSTPGTEAWLAGADLNKDLTVNVVDFLILRNGFGRSGDQ
ncbi:MAG: dockerin type I repeat-containing protein [Nitrospirae bacterium]|nr:dockerin type I repeat-containing protein [Fimbriimonadaceae bacterium]